MIQPRDLLPHFTVNTVSGRRVAYRDLWQRRQLVLVCLADIEDAAARAYVDQLAATEREFDTVETTLVVTRDAVIGVPLPGVVVADRWGEVYFVAAAARVEELPSAGALVEWATHVRMHCPECEGETR